MLPCFHQKRPKPSFEAVREKTRSKKNTVAAGVSGGLSPCQAPHQRPRRCGNYKSSLPHRLPPSRDYSHPRGDSGVLPHSGTGGPGGLPEGRADHRVVKQPHGNDLMNRCNHHPRQFSYFVKQKEIHMRQRISCILRLFLCQPAVILKQTGK